MPASWRWASYSETMQTRALELDSGFFTGPSPLGQHRLLRPLVRFPLDDCFQVTHKPETKAYGDAPGKAGETRFEVKPTQRGATLSQSSANAF